MIDSVSNLANTIKIGNHQISIIAEGAVELETRSVFCLINKQESTASLLRIDWELQHLSNGFVHNISEESKIIIVSRS